MGFLNLVFLNFSLITKYKIYIYHILNYCKRLSL